MGSPGVKQHLREQIEQIIEQGEGRNRSIIIQVKSPEGDLSAQRTAEVVAASLHRRGLSQSSRELLPGRTSNRRAVRQGDPHAWWNRLAVNKLKVQRHNELKSVMQSHFIRDAAIDRGGEPGESRLTPIWPSRSIVMEIQKEQLWKLPDNLAGVRNIYANRQIQTPRIQKVKDLPDEVREATASSWGVSKIGAMAVWGAYGVRGEGVRVAVLDTGVDGKHGALQGRIAESARFDSNGSQVKRAKVEDSDGHGTHCCGTICGGRTSKGKWIGVAPEAKLAVGRVLDGRRGGTEAQVLAGLRWAIELGVDVISLSLGGLTLEVEVLDTYTEAFAMAMAAGITVVTAIGNEGSQTTGSPGNNWLSFAVGATDHNDKAAGFSGGRTHIMSESRTVPKRLLPLVYSKPDISAPGVAIFSSTPRGRYDHYNGTSMAAPHVAGAIALLLSETTIREQYQGLERVQAVKGFLQGSVRELGESGQNHRFGFGRLDILRAIGFAKERGL